MQNLQCAIQNLERGMRYPWHLQVQHAGCFFAYSER